MALTKLEVLQNYLDSLEQKDLGQVSQVEQEPVEEIDVSLPTSQTKNNGPAIGYLAHKLGLGTVQSVEGISDFLIGGVADLLGGEVGDEFAEQLMKNNWLDYSAADEWYNPGTGMAVAGQVLQGLGGMLPSIAVGFIPGAGTAATLGTLGTSAAGSATAEKVQETGELNAQAWGYGTAVGLTEAGIEALTGGIGGTKAAKGVASLATKKLGTGVGTRLAANFLGEAVEEGLSYGIDPLINYAFGYDKTLKEAYNNGFDFGELGKTALIGGLTGATMAGASTTIDTVRARGYNNLVASEQAAELSEATAKANKAQASGKADSTIREKTIENTAESLSQRLQKMNDFTRERFLASHQSLAHMFNEDGTLIEASVKNVASESATTYNTNAYSASLRGLENTLEYKPVSSNATNVSKDVMNTITKLTDGKAQVVLTDDLNQGLDGAYKDGVIYLNAKSTDYQKALFVGVHEVVHTLEGTQAYNDLAKFIAESVSKDPALQGKYGYAKYRSVYDAILDGNWTELTKDYQATTEIFADFMANEIASNPKMLNSIMARNRNILARFLNWVRDCIAKLGMSKEERALRNELIKLEKVFVKALEESTGGRSLADVEKDAIAAEKAHQAEELKKQQAEDKNVQNVKFEEEKPANAELALVRAKTDVESDVKSTNNLTETQAIKRGIIDKKGDTIRYNLFTFDNGGKQQLESNLKKNGFTKAEIDETAKTMQDIADYFRVLEADVEGLVDWNSAKVLYDAKSGKSVFTALVKNGDYPLNIDLSTICKKRKALTKVLNTLVKRGYIDTVDLSAENIVKINEILKKYEYEVACPACFVETKRYRVDDWANKFLDPWNELIKNAVPNAQNLDFVNGTYSVKGAQVDTEYLNRVIKEHTKVSETGRRSKDSIAKMATLILNNESVRGYINKADMIGSIGLEKMKQHQDKLYSLVLQRSGTATPKIIQEVQPYNGELGMQNQLAKRSDEVGGVRMFSFSDFTVLQTFDYLQVAADLASKRAKMQTYTKEITFAELFGQTGMKINLSMIPAIDKSVGKENAGLDEKGKPIYSKQWGVDYDTAKNIMFKDGYNGNVGTATIGISKNHILKLLDDPVTNYIIPYHKSSINPTLAKMMDIDWYTDYTSVQNTRDSNGEKITATQAKEFNFFKELAEAKDARKMAQNYLEWCKQNNYIPKFDEFAWHPNYYKLLVDFQVYKTVDGKEVYAPQTSVRMKFPDNFKEILKRELKTQEELDTSRDVNFEKVMKETVQVLQKGSSLRASIDVDKAYLNAVENRDTATMEKMVAQAAKEAGYTSEKLYHGTTSFGFTEVKTRGVDKYAWSPFFATNNPNIATTYSGAAGTREIGSEKIRQKEQIGNYALYANTNNFLVVDGKGAEWDQIDSEYGKKTRVIARNALNKGYSGVLIKNIVDFGIEWNDILNDVTDLTSDVYIFFKPETQVKSADLVTYDDSGNVIPLSERFKTNKTDIRFSVDVDLAEKTAGRVQTVVHKESVKEIWDRITNELKYGARNKWLELQISLTDQQAAIVQSGKNLGINVQGEIQRARSAKAAAQNMITYKQTDFNGNVVGESLKDIFEPIQKKGEAYARNFNEYLLHHLNVDRMSAVERGLAETNKPVFEEKVDTAFSLEKIAEFEEKFPSFKETAEKVWKYSKNLLQYRVDAGLITQAQADQMNQLYPHYVPAYYDTTNTPSSGASVGKNKFAVRTGIKSAKGSSGKADIKDVPMSLAKQTESVVKAAAINKLVTKLYDKALKTKTFIDLEIAGKEFLTDPDVNYDDIVTKDNQIAFYKDGERITLDISEYMYAGFEGLGAYRQAEISPLEMISSSGIGLFKKAVTSANPLFAIRNAIRDFCDAWFQTKYSSKTFLLRETKSFFRVFAGKNTDSKYNKLWQTYVSMGGFESGYYDSDVGVYDKRRPVRKWIAKQINRFERINNYIEQTPRFAEFVASVEAGNSYEQALYDSAEVTTNFSRGGSLTKKLNRTLIPFLNPAVQGWSKLWRTWVDPMDNMSEKQLKSLAGSSKGRLYLSYYGQLVMKVVALGLGAGILNDLLYDEDDEEYAKIPLNVKENNFLIKTPNGKFIKLPKGRVMALYGQTATRISAYARGDEDALNAWDWFKTSWDMISPVDAASRTIFAPIGDVIANRTWYGTPIESRTMEQMYEAKDRYDEKTSSIAIAIGQRLNVSPKKVHYLIDQYSGVLGDLILPLTTEKAEQGWVASNFIVDPEYTNNISTKYYDLKDEITYAKSGGDLTALMLYKYLNASDDLLSDIYKAKRDIANYNTLSNDEKKLLISSLPTLSEQLNLAGKATLTDAEKHQYTDILQALLNGTMAQITANVENFEDIAIKNGFAENFAKFIYSDMYNSFDESKKNSAYNKAMTYYFEKYKAEMLGQQVGHKYALYEACGANETSLYLAEIGKIESDKDRNGNTIAGSRKKKVEKYIQSLRLSAQQKHILLYLAGYTPTDTGKGMIRRYLINNGYSQKELNDLWN